MKIDAIKNGIVLDHIKAGTGMILYQFLKLDDLDCPVALIKNASSKKLGKKDIIKIDSSEYNLDLDVIGFIDPEITVDIIKNGVLCEKRHLELPEKLTNILTCKNPRCITSVEQELPHIFHLTDRENKIYRCAYCEAKAKN